MKAFDTQATLDAMLDVDHPRKLAAAEWASTELVGPVDSFDRDRWRRAAAFGVQGLTITSEFGGNDATAVDALLTFEGLGLGCDDNGTVFALAAQVFPAQMSLARFGTDAQKQRWLPGLCDGSLIAAFAASEPGAGSDTSAIATTAVSQGDGTYRLDGTKCWVTLGPVSDMVIVFATTEPEAGHWGLTAFVIETGTDGVVVGDAVPKLGLRTCPFGTIELNGCVVGEEQMLGGLGSGHAIFSAAVELERAFLYGPQLGATERVLQRTIARARGREQFGQPIGSFQAVSHRIVDMKVRHESSRLMLYAVAARHDRGEPVRMASALAKLHASEFAVTSALDAVRVHGAEGYTDAGCVEAELRDSIGGLTFAGTSDIQRNIVARLLKVDRPLSVGSERRRGDET